MPLTFARTKRFACQAPTNPPRAFGTFGSSKVERPPHNRSRKPCGPSGLLPVARLDKADVGAGADHDVIEQANAEQISGLAQTAGDSDILLARRRVAAGVVMNYEERRGIAENDRLEQLTWLCCRCSYVT